MRVAEILAEVKEVYDVVMAHKAMARDEIQYSDELVGDARNYHRNARFDFSDGYLGLTQWEGRRGPLGYRNLQRVLLSPAQVLALRQFITPRKPRRRATRSVPK
jgi:hypothetical protein